MNYCGIDLASKTSALCVMGEHGEVLSERWTEGGWTMRGANSLRASAGPGWLDEARGDPTGLDWTAGGWTVRGREPLDMPGGPGRAGIDSVPVALIGRWAISLSLPSSVACDAALPVTLDASPIPGPSRDG